jgi:hypothetical protein
MHDFLTIYDFYFLSFFGKIRASVMTDVMMQKELSFGGLQ